ncbi:phage tail protein [Labrys sp. WJW]|uniref:phage tail protein n=1 Tax=Labrys sp. WJW TaxID=1737983 RepID=UPI00082A5AE7|nr:phage tail protein [Labrys sp. WJW]OCC05271.1 phage tail protein [Labrys sp. WJW]
MNPTFGVVFIPDNNETQPPSPAEMSVIGLVLPSDGASATLFPLDKPVNFNSKDATYLAGLGTGELADEVALINNQLKGISARIIAVRVAKGATDTETVANIVGTEAAGTGMYALLRAGQLLGLIPRSLGFGRYTGIFSRDAGGEALANPILAALPAVLEALFATAKVMGPGTTRQDALDLRETINSDRIEFIDQTLLVAKGTDTIEVSSSGAALGIQVQLDHLTEGVPVRSVANNPVQGILGLKRYDGFSLTDGATDAQQMLAKQVGVVVRGQQGVETAIADSGFSIVSFAGCGTDELWRFISAKRTRDWLHLTLLKSIRKRLASKISVAGIQAVENDMMAVLQWAKHRGYILGGKVGFERDKNEPANLRKGAFRFWFSAEEQPDLILVVVDSRRDASALDGMLDTLLTQSTTLIAA